MTKNKSSVAKVTNNNSEAVQPFETGSSMIFLMETEDAYLMQVDLPSVQMPIGEIISKNHELTVTAATGKKKNSKSKVKDLLPNILSLHTLGGKIKSFYQEGALYILLPKGNAHPSAAAALQAL